MLAPGSGMLDGRLPLRKWSASSRPIFARHPGQEQILPKSQMAVRTDGPDTRNPAFVRAAGSSKRAITRGKSGSVALCHEQFPLAVSRANLTLRSIREEV